MPDSVVRKWTGLTLADVERLDEQGWVEIYSELEATLEFASELIRGELGAFAAQSGRSRLAMTHVRVKKRDSFVNKMLRLVEDRERLEEKFNELGPALSVFELVNDLVGGRMIFYFERDILEGILFWLGYPTYVPLEIASWVQDISGFDSELARPLWLKAVLAPVPKRSGYEALHLILTVDPDLLVARFEGWCHKQNTQQQSAGFPWGALKADFPDLRERIRALDGLTFEIQCQTILEHTWAEVEHRFRYSPDKFEEGAEPRDEDQTRTFRNFKAILRAAQMHQNSIRTGFGRWDSDEDAMVGRSTSVNLGERANFWTNPAERKEIETLDQEIGWALFKDRRDKEKPSGDTWKPVMDRFDATVARLGQGKPRGTNLLRKTKALDPEEYGRRRTLLLLAGFILGHAWSPGGKFDDAEEQNVRHRAAKAYLEANLPTEAIPWVFPRVAAVRLYEHLRILDEWFWRTTENEVFHDPLIVARAASVHYRHFGSFRRANQLLDEGLAQIEPWTKRQEEVPRQLTAPHMFLRRAEGAWAAYQLEGRQSTDLVEALNATVKGIGALDPNQGWEGRLDETDREILRGKLLSLGITLALYEASAQQGGRQLRGAEGGWRTLRELRSTLEDISLQLLDWLEAQKEIGDSSLRLQGAAIAHSLQAAHASRKGDRDRLLVDARLEIRQSRQIVERKVRSRRGGAMSFHADIARELEAFVYSLCSHEATSKSSARRPNSSE